ncbi:helix-turn-helix domain-containing protein [Jannaschia donghaensis]|uniref:Transcriptional regulator PpsR n=1 Tax=Jannaschia donghaensis TaxID=420998 RepID=A0A0M6YGS6_9RHOB|nr:helix-turn-helix domain-containing protein [Jannaschia donghaensis]CTQ49160.1 transcriptional regulator PpsR [Jannaschia donghaensis]
MSIRDIRLRNDLPMESASAGLADVVISVSRDDRVIDVQWQDARGAATGRDWIGRSLFDLTSPASQAQILRALRSLGDRSPAPSRAQISLSSDTGAATVLSVLVQPAGDGYELIGLDQGPMIDAVARSDRLQAALEAAHNEDRDTSGLHRAVMTHLHDAIVVVDVSTGRILDLSKPAVGLLAVAAEGHGSLASGTAFTQCFEGRRRTEFIESLCSAATANRTVTAELRAGRGHVTLKPDLGRIDDAVVLICHLSTDEETSETTEFDATLERSVDAVVCLDERGRIIRTNPAFLRMVSAASHSLVEGCNMMTLLLRGAIDIKAMTDPKRPATFSTHLVGLTGQRTTVEITTADLPGGGHGLILRDVGLAAITRGPAEDSAAESQTRAESDAARQVGTVPLRDIVAGMTDVIERECVETALTLTRNNRVAAAEMLGLSRQSLYVKLRKFGLLDNKGDQ